MKRKTALEWLVFLTSEAVLGRLLAFLMPLLVWILFFLQAMAYVKPEAWGFQSGGTLWTILFAFYSIAGSLWLYRQLRDIQ